MWRVQFYGYIAGMTLFDNSHRDHRQPLGQRVAETSLLSSCMTCQNKCCENKYFTVTKEDHDQIVANGHPDYMARINIPEGEFYMMDYRGDKCSYLDDAGKCSIEEIKPTVCKAYPAKVVSDHKGNLVRIEYSLSCPGVKFLDHTQKNALEENVHKQFESVGLDIFCKINDAYDARGNPEELARLGATVIGPRHVP